MKKNQKCIFSCELWGAAEKRKYKRCITKAKWNFFIYIDIFITYLTNPVRNFLEFLISLKQILILPTEIFIALQETLRNNYSSFMWLFFGNFLAKKKTFPNAIAYCRQLNKADSQSADIIVLLAQKKTTINWLNKSERERERNRMKKRKDEGNIVIVKRSIKQAAHGI